MDGNMFTVAKGYFLRIKGNGISSMPLFVRAMWIGYGKEVASEKIHVTLEELKVFDASYTPCVFSASQVIIIKIGNFIRSS